MNVTCGTCGQEKPTYRRTEGSPERIVYHDDPQGVACPGGGGLPAEPEEMALLRNMMAKRAEDLAKTPVQCPSQVPFTHGEPAVSLKHLAAEFYMSKPEEWGTVEVQAARKALRCLHIAVDANVASDVEKKVDAAIRHLQVCCATTLNDWMAEREEMRKDANAVMAEQLRTAEDLQKKAFDQLDDVIRERDQYHENARQFATDLHNEIVKNEKLEARIKELEAKLQPVLGDDGYLEPALTSSTDCGLVIEGVIRGDDACPVPSVPYCSGCRHLYVDGKPWFVRDSEAS